MAEVLAIVTLTASLVACGDSRPPAPGGFVTILLGRTQWQPYVGCHPLTGGVSLDRVAHELALRRLTATGAVVTDWIGESERQCLETVEYPTWQDLATLRDSFGWTFVSNGSTHGDTKGMSKAEQERETCGSRAALEAHGHKSSWGLYGYANNRVDTNLQQELVSRCFAYGRRYGEATNKRGSMRPPWFQTSQSVSGGRCRKASPGCETVEIDKSYADPHQLGRAMAPGVGRWKVMQFYRFVDGVHRSGYNRWDCSSPDWHRHWTSRAELYCFADFLRAIDAIDPRVTVTDPASVATAWRRGDPAHPPGQ